MEDFIDWTAEVEEITPDGKLSIVYRNGKHTKDPVGVTVTIPEDILVTPEWVRQRMEENAGTACEFWCNMDREMRMKKKRRAITKAVGKVRVAGQTNMQREEPTRPIHRDSEEEPIDV